MKIQVSIEGVTYEVAIQDLNASGYCGSGWASR